MDQDWRAVLSEAVRDFARSVLSEQGSVPLSPGAWSASGKYELCTAAVIAVAATGARYGTDAAADFYERLSREQSKRMIIDQLTSAGLPESYGEAKLAENDATPDEFRRSLAERSIETFEWI